MHKEELVKVLELLKQEGYYNQDKIVALLSCIASSLADIADILNKKEGE